MIKARLKATLIQSGLLRIWNRHLGGNRVRVLGTGNQLQIGQSLLTHTRIRIEGQNNIVSIGNGCRLHDLKILVSGNSLRVEIADRCRVRGKIKAEDVGSQIAVGAGTTMENAYLGAYEGTSIRIGEKCMFSDQVGLRTETCTPSWRRHRRPLNPSRSIAIEPGVWLFAGESPI
jgi:acetyltransferase-like isoleucine patch superfamily enzyme